MKLYNNFIKAVIQYHAQKIITLSLCIDVIMQVKEHDKANTD